MARTSVFARGENLAEGAIHLPRGNKIKGGAPARASALVGERLSVVDVGDDGKISDFRLVGQKNTPPKDGEWSSNIGVYPQGIPGGQAAGASPRPTEQGNDRGPGRRAGSPNPTHTRGDRLGISGAWHRWRPGGRSRYSAAALRACGVTAMRAARGAASSAQATDRSLSGRPESSFPPLGPCSRRGIAIPGPKWPANRAAPFFRLA